MVINTQKINNPSPGRGVPMTETFKFAKRVTTAVALFFGLFLPYDRPMGDIDDNDPISYADKYFDLKFQLENILRREVDLLEQKSIRNQLLRREIERTKVQIYGRRNPHMA